MPERCFSSSQNSEAGELSTGPEHLWKHQFGHHADVSEGARGSDGSWTESGRCQEDQEDIICQEVVQVVSVSTCSKYVPLPQAKTQMNHVEPKMDEWLLHRFVLFSFHGR